MDIEDAQVVQMTTTVATSDGPAEYTTYACATAGCSTMLERPGQTCLRCSLGFEAK